MLSSVAASPGSCDIPPEHSRLNELLARVALGDEEALAGFYDASSRTVYGVALRVVRDPAVAEEVTMEVYLQVWRTASTFDLERGSPSAWLVRLTRSRAIDWLRSKQARLREAVPLDSMSDFRDWSANPESACLTAARSVAVRKAMAALPADQQRVIELGFFAGLSHSEIALELGKPLGTIKTRMRMAMMKLRDALYHDGEVVV